jgi:predicted nucleic acid-binding protein
VILVDTTPLVALCDAKDALHARAIRDLDRLAREHFVASDAVLAEAMHLLPDAAARARVVKLVRTLPVAPWLDESVAASRLDTLQWMTRYADNQPDWADALLAVASSREKRSRVWTYDSEFTTTWRRLDGTRIPLAAK